MDHLANSQIDSEGENQKFDSLMQEIQVLKEEVVSLKKNNGLYEKANRDASIGTWEVDLTKKVVYWSSVTKEIFGVPQDYLPSLETAIDFFAEGKSRTTMSKVVAEAIENGKAYDEILQLCNTKGELIWARAKGATEFENGFCVRLYGTIQDVNDQHIQAQKIEKQEKKFHGIFDSTLQFIGFLDVDGTLQEINHAALNFAGLKCSDVIGKKFWDCHWWQTSEITRQQLKEAIAEAATGKLIQYEVAVLNAKKEPIWILFNLKPLFNADGKVFAIIPVGMPIQDMVDARTALNKKNEELEHFAFVASHDLREPLRMIKSFLGLLEKKYADLLDEDGKKYIAYAVDGAERMRELIEGLLNFATVGSDSIQKQSVNMNDILSTVKIFFKNNIEETNAVIKTADLPVIPASPVYMQLLLQNLIANAIKYQPVGTAPEIEIKYVDDANYWQFSVKDNGIGIKEEFLETIFKIFKRLHTKSDYEGTGLGLSTSKKIVEAHGGEIWVDSEHGKGSTFHFTIPK